MAIPEFILKKLIVPGSIKETSNGFQFKILNTFAPAVLSRIKIRTGEKTIPGSDILIFRNDQLMATGLDVNPDRPMALPVGMEFTIESRVPASGAPIYLNAVTREVGEIDFCLSSGVKPTKNRAMKKFIFSYFQPKMKADLSIYPDEIVGKASPFILGQFVEHLERCVYDGIWVSDGSKLRADTLDLIKQINPPLIRYTGGNFASGYHW